MDCEIVLVMSSKLPAIIGGNPVFEKKLPLNLPDFAKYKREILTELDKVLESNMLSNVNIYVKKFEDKIADFLDVDNAIAFNSCTTGMILSIQNLELQGGEMILPSFSFSATAHMAYWNRMNLKFAEINEQTWNIDDRKVESILSKKTTAILAVHMYGNPARINELSRIAKKNDIKLLFDAAHALGSLYHGNSSAKHDHISSYSLSPTKLLSSVEGGFITTNDDDLAEKLRVSRNYGSRSDYTVRIPGFNARMSEMHAATGYVLFDYLEETILNRQNTVDLYTEELKDLPGVSFQKLEENCTSTNKDYSILIDPTEFKLTRDDVAKALKYENIDTRFYFYPPIHELEPYTHFYENNLPITNRIATRVLSLPITNYMQTDIVLKICDAIKRIQENSQEIKNKIHN